MAPQFSVHVAFIYSCEDTGCSLAVVLLCLEDDVLLNEFFLLVLCQLLQLLLKAEATCGLKYWVLLLFIK